MTLVNYTMLSEAGPEMVLGFYFFQSAIIYRKNTLRRVVVGGSGEFPFPKEYFEVIRFHSLNPVS